MIRGLCKVIKVMFAMLTLACIILSVLVIPGITNAAARADFATWANRSTRSLEPADYNTNGTCSCQICSWKGTQGIGNVGIGNGSVAAFTDGTTKDETLYPDFDLQGVVTTEGSQYPDVNRVTGDTVSKSLNSSAADTPDNVTESNSTEIVAGNSTENATGLKIGGTPGIFTYGKPYPGIMSEYPIESTAVYGKLTGLRMPDGRNVNIGIKSIGYEY